MPFIDAPELAGVLGEAPATEHRALTGLLADRIVGRVSHGTASTVEPEILPDGQWHRRGCRVPQLCDALGLRASWKDGTFAFGVTPRGCSDARTVRWRP